MRAASHNSKDIYTLSSRESERERERVGALAEWLTLSLDVGRVVSDYGRSARSLLCTYFRSSRGKTRFFAFPEHVSRNYEVAGRKAGREERKRFFYAETPIPKKNPGSANGLGRALERERAARACQRPTWTPIRAFSRGENKRVEYVWRPLCFFPTVSLSALWETRVF